MNLIGKNKSVDICILNPGLLEAKTRRGGGIEEAEYRIGLQLSSYFNILILAPFYREHHGLTRINQRFAIDEIYFPAVKNYPPKSVLERYMVFFSAFLFSFLAAVKLVSLRKRQLKLLILDSALTGLLPAMLARTMKIKVIFSEGNDYPWIMPYVYQARFSVSKKLGWSLLLATGRIMCNLSNYIRAQNNSIMKGMTKYGVDSSKIHVISAGVDTNIFRPLRETSYPYGNINIGFIGRLVEEKGVPLLLKVVRMALKECPNARFIIMGEGASKDYFLNLPNVEHVGFVSRDELPVWLSKVQVVLFFQKNLGLAELEALASGKAIIACNAGEVSHTIRHLENGILCKPEADSYVDAIKILVHNPSLLKKLADNARESALKYFSWKAVGMQWACMARKGMSV